MEIYGYNARVNGQATFVVAWARTVVAEQYLVVVVVEVVADKCVIVVLVAGRVWGPQQRLGHMKFVAYPYNP